MKLNLVMLIIMDKYLEYNIDDVIRKFMIDVNYQFLIRNQSINQSINQINQ